MKQINHARRQILGGLAASTAAAPMVLAGSAHADTDNPDGFTYEVTRTEEEWRAQLDEFQYSILRQGGTEPRRSSPYWEETRDGLYSCAACDLPLFDARWKTVLEIGWVFFRQSEPISILTDIDRIEDDEMEDGETTMTPELSEAEIRALDELAGVEARCRRCGSHLGHVVSVNSTVLYCVNGASLNFALADA